MYEWVGDVSAEVREHLRALVAAHDLTPGPGGARMLPLRPTLDLPPGLDPFLRPHTVYAAWLIALAPSQQIPAHTDPPLPGPRLHIPIEANPGCWSYSGRHWQQLTLGGVYTMNPTIEHGAVNWGSTRRVHLIVDLIHLQESA